MFTSKKSEVLGSDDLEQVSQWHDSAAECWKVMQEAGPFIAWGCFEHYKTGSISGHCPLSQKHSYRFSNGPTQRHLATCEVSGRHWRWISLHVEDHHVEMTDPALKRMGETFQCARDMVMACLGHPLYGLGPNHEGPIPVSAILSPITGPHPSLGHPVSNHRHPCASCFLECFLSPIAPGLFISHYLMNGIALTSSK